MKTSSKILAVVVIVAIVAFFVYGYDSRTTTTSTNGQITNVQVDNTPVQNENNTNTTPTKPTSKPVTSTSKYKDGSYSVTTQYMSPGGLDNLGVTLAIAKDKITSVSIQNGASDRTSANYQNRFSSGIQSAVIGQNLASLSIDVVSGASLTSNSFNDALSQIRAQAKN
jgi:uncharacterized protein with FMN-binding domain